MPRTIWARFRRPLIWINGQASNEQTVPAGDALPIRRRQTWNLDLRPPSCPLVLAASILNAAQQTVLCCAHVQRRLRVLGGLARVRDDGSQRASIMITMDAPHRLQTTSPSGVACLFAAVGDGCDRSQGADRRTEMMMRTWPRRCQATLEARFAVQQLGFSASAHS